MTSFTIAVSSCALFRQETGDKGVAFPFVKALTMVNQRLTELDQATEEQFEIVLIPSDGQDIDHLTKNIEKYGLKSDRVCMITGEKPLLDLLNEIEPVLYLSTNPQNVKEAITAGHGAATMFQREYHEPSDEVLRVAFDGDGVLFSDESERVYKEKGLQSFYDNERDKEDEPLIQGPLSKFFRALVHLQQKFGLQNCPIRTYLVTSRGTSSPGLRALKTLQRDKLEINEAFFLCGAHKGPVLKAIKPHIFFDDQTPHVDGALQNGVIGAHVPYGVRNE
ncbi:cytosolic 5'-nucleotidase 1A-like [Ctenopharyngodon idella]|uniref:cytosolic 5'-nucleotidase 1A-like n=1 Tax=Ctenopharyngodon idella TaxID=7959 RepID=UPI00222FBEBF|nr:cytosolic 5'-nucleotidase 1A-like [Ctenopharyngodon idella]